MTSYREFKGGNFFWDTVYTIIAKRVHYSKSTHFTWANVTWPWNRLWLIPTVVNTTMLAWFMSRSATRKLAYFLFTHNFGKLRHIWIIISLLHTISFFGKNINNFLLILIYHTEKNSIEIAILSLHSVCKNRILKHKCSDMTQFGHIKILCPAGAKHVVRSL